MADKLLLPRMPMGRRFTIGAAIALVPILSLSYLLLAYEWTAFRKADEATYRFESLRAALIAMEKISAERKPMNSLLGQDLPVPSARSVLLEHARLESDEWLARLLDTLRPARCAACAGDYARVKKLEADLAAARGQADRLIALPRRQRGDLAVNRVVEGMFAVVDEFNPVAISQTMGVARGDAKAFNCIVVARLVTNLREHAGRLGSQMTAALAMERPLTMEERLAIERTHGRIDELQTLLEARMVEHPLLAPDAFAAMNAQYFEAGQRYIRTVQTLANQPGGAHLSTGLFADRYVPYLRSIVAFRNAVLERAEHTVRENRTAALIAVSATAAAQAVLLIAFVWIIASFRRDVLRPFVQATQSIQAIAAGDLTQDIPSSFSRREIRALFEAIRILKSNSVEHAQLEAERARLMEELATMAQTDPLTRLFNRRAFETRARAMCAQAHVDGSNIALIMLDIDHFKRINDTFGHALGDDALRLVAGLCRRHVGDSEIVARIGGEEFAIMMRTTHVATTYHMADALREDIAHAAILTDSGADCRITASFGLAIAEPAAADVTTLLKEADRMLYAAKMAGRNRVTANVDLAGTMPTAHQTRA